MIRTGQQRRAPVRAGSQTAKSQQRLFHLAALRDEFGLGGSRDVVIGDARHSLDCNRVELFSQRQDLRHGWVHVLKIEDAPVAGAAAGIDKSSVRPRLCS